MLIFKTVLPKPDRGDEPIEFSELRAGTAGGCSKAARVCHLCSQALKLCE